MSVHKSVELYCDGESRDCEAAGGSANSDHSFTTAYAVREWARLTRGWVQRNNLDFCGACKKDREERLA